MTNPTVYPITAKFEEEVQVELAKVQFDRDSMDLIGHVKWAFAKSLAATMAENLGEYEHGTVDVEDLFPEAMREEFEKGIEVLKNEVEPSLADRTDENKLDLKQALLNSLSNIYMDLLLTVLNTEA